MNNTNAHKAGYKHTPLGWIPEEWKFVNFEDTADNKIKWSITGGPFGSNLKAQDYTPNGIRIIQLQNIGDGNFVDDYKIYTSINKADELLSCNIYPGEIIVAKMGDPVARACIMPLQDKRYLMASDGIRLAVDEKKYDKHYIFNYINSSFFRRRAIAASTGSTRQRIGLDDLKKLPVLSPTIKEQQKIATILYSWDKAIQKTQHLIQQLKQRNKGLMQQLLTGKKDWKERRLGDIFERVTRKNSEANTNVVTISAQRGFVKQGDFFNKQVASEILDNYFLVEKGEICYNKSYSKGYDWGATKRLNDFDKAVVTTLYICFRIKDTTATSGEFFEYFFESGILDKGLSKIAHEGGRAHGLLNVTPSDFFSIKIKVPEKDEQLRIYDILRAATNELKLYEQQFTYLQQQKKGLMQKLLNGEVRVKTEQAIKN